MTLNYLLVFSFFLYCMYYESVLGINAWLSSVISYLNYKCISLNFYICFVYDRSNLQVCVIFY